MAEALAANIRTPFIYGGIFPNFWDWAKFWKFQPL